MSTTLKTLTVLGALALAPVGAYAGSGETRSPLDNGFAAGEALALGTASGISLESAYTSGVKAEHLLQAAVSRSGASAVDARGAWRSTSSRPNLIGPRQEKGSVTLPVPGLNPADGKKQEPPKKDIASTIMKWLPIAVVYYLSVISIMNPLGSAAWAVKSFAMFALMGTVTKLIAEFKKK